MRDSQNHLTKLFWILLPVLIAIVLAGASIAFASLTFSGTTISGDAGVNIDTTSTISIGASSSTGITIGRPGITSTFEGNITQSNGFSSLGSTTINGNATATGNLNVSGNIYGTIPASVNAQSGISYTLQSTDNGKVLTFSNSSPVTLIVPAGLGVGFNCLIVQTGAGNVTPTASATSIYQRQSFTQTAGQYAVATLVAISPDTFVLSGDLQ
jgi:hypothetical protein